MAEPITLTPSGGSSGNVSGKLTIVNAAMIKIDIVQLAGFIPLTDCDVEDCRTFNGSCYINKVFGTIGVNKSTYENDWNSFYIYDSLSRTIQFNLQKLNNLGVWESLGAMTSSYGINYAYGSLSGHPKYRGFRINWGAVLTLHGAGIYRIKVRSSGSGNNDIRYPICKTSEPFKLLPYSCELANRTVKFESQLSGIIGSIDTDGATFDLCNISLYDSIRMPGFFGFEKSSFDSVELEYQNGLIDPVRDEILQKFKFVSHLMPKYIHDRFKAYGLMADLLRVSDYNFNNSDYNIRQKLVVKDGGYEPVYNKGNRQAAVTVDFKEGVQGVIKTSSCG